MQLVQAKRPAISLNMRNSTISDRALDSLCNMLCNPAYYVTALCFKFCFLDFYQIIDLEGVIKFNKSLVKIDLSKNGLKSMTIKLFMEALQDNYCLAHLDLSGNFLDNVFAEDLAELIKEN